MERYSLFLLKVPLNTNQPTNRLRWESWNVFFSRYF